MTPIAQILADQPNRDTTGRPVELCICVQNDAEAAVVLQWFEDCIRDALPRPTTGEVYVTDKFKGRYRA